MPTRLSLFALISSILALATGCGKRGTAVEAGNRDQIIHIGNLAEPVDLDPHIISSHQDFNVVMSLFEGLVQYDAKTAEPVPAIAERWEMSADNLTWTFHLRKTAKWSNGEPVTAHDFVYAFRRILSPGLGAEYANTLFVLKNGEEIFSKKVAPEQLGAKAADDYTLVLSLARPVPYLLTMLCHSTFYPLPKATIEKFGKSDQRGNPWTRVGNIVSNGYFTLAEWKPNQFIRVKRSETYWDRE
ncbi:MAG: peptide ABC transporter substrate-binding protein, partial [Verrucomicrobiota bacterium]